MKKLTTLLTITTGLFIAQSSMALENPLKSGKREVEKFNCFTTCTAKACAGKETTGRACLLKCPKEKKCRAAFEKKFPNSVVPMAPLPPALTGGTATTATLPDPSQLPPSPSGNVTPPPPPPLPPAMKPKADGNKPTLTFREQVEARKNNPLAGLKKPASDESK